ncbi:glycosyltransferase family 2 protein [Acidipila sp. EB88]|uniref:glycosyltransferase family 2 protein n=1 Tax=Acidipila sp. EB88 TaxID=2305226 RepID=UPI000F5E7978|nr:glycosyltransferase family A protein [Acidipila sp. EB88]RRA47249.1 glycosyltransferase family 2 protein [Acidipila sp. EB88]
MSEPAHRPVPASSPEQPRGPRLSIAIGIATSGRPVILAETLQDLARQTRRPDQVFVLYSKPEDIGNLEAQLPGMHFGKAQGGLCEKRNQILDAAAGFDLIFFMDDDFYLDPGYLQAMEQAFLEDSTLVAGSGIVLADGARGPGLKLADARSVLSRAEQQGVARHSRHTAFNTYGCNMCFRLATIRQHSVRFDEKLPAYGWYEDIDFSRRMARFGSVMRLDNALGVHLGAKVGRVSGVRLGYSQVINPFYLARKGSFPWSNALRSVGRNMLANIVRSIRPESYVDRRGRLRGNAMAMLDLLRGRLRPDRILHMR